MAEARKRRKSDGARQANQVVRSRTAWLMLIFGVITFLLLFWKLFDLQILRHEELESKAVSQQTRSSVITASRGTIYDRSGEVHHGGDGEHQPQGHRELREGPGDRH